MFVPPALIVAGASRLNEFHYTVEDLFRVVAVTGGSATLRDQRGTPCLGITAAMFHLDSSVSGYVVAAARLRVHPEVIETRAARWWRA